MENADMPDYERIGGYEAEVRRALADARALHERLCDLFTEGLDIQCEGRGTEAMERAYEVGRHVGTAGRSLSVAVDCLADARL